MIKGEVFKRNNGSFYYSTISDTGHNILSSDGYAKKETCISTITLAKKNIVNVSLLKLGQTGKEQYSFTVAGSQQSITGYSMPFHSAKERDNWIKLMQQYLPTSAVIDLT